jgi:hypothetical protein
MYELRGGDLKYCNRDEKSVIFIFCDFIQFS